MFLRFRGSMDFGLAYIGHGVMVAQAAMIWGAREPAVCTTSTLYQCW